MTVNDDNNRRTDDRPTTDDHVLREAMRRGLKDEHARNVAATIRVVENDRVGHASHKIQQTFVLGVYAGYHASPNVDMADVYAAIQFNPGVRSSDGSLGHVEPAVDGEPDDEFWPEVLRLYGERWEDV